MFTMTSCITALGIKPDLTKLGIVKFTLNEAPKIPVVIKRAILAVGKGDAAVRFDLEQDGFTLTLKFRTDLVSAFLTEFLRPKNELEVPKQH